MGIFMPAGKDELKERKTDCLSGLAAEIGFSPENLLTKENLKKALYYPASGDDFSPLEKFGKETDVFIYADTGLHGFTNLYSGRKNNNLIIIDKPILATLEHVVQIHNHIPVTEKIDDLIRDKFSGYEFSDGRFRTEPARTPVGIFRVKTSNGPKYLFYIVNEGYWTYLHLFQMGKNAPKILFMHTGGQEIAFGGGDIPAFEDEVKGIKVLFKAKPGKIIIK